MSFHFARSQTTLSVVALMLLSACATPVLESRLAGPQPGQVGLVYALPKGQIQLIAERKSVEAEAVALASQDAADTAAKFATSEAKKNEAKAQVKDLVDQGSVRTE